MTSTSIREIMKTLTIIGVLATIGMVTFSTKEKMKATQDEMIVEVVLSYEDCAVNPAIYQVVENERSKVADLKRMDKADPSKGHVENIIKVYEFFTMAGIDPEKVEERSVKEREDGSRVILYAYEGE